MNKHLIRFVALLLVPCLAGGELIPAGTATFWNQEAALIADPGVRGDLPSFQEQAVTPPLQFLHTILGSMFGRQSAIQVATGRVKTMGPTRAMSSLEYDIIRKGFNKNLDVVFHLSAWPGLSWKKQGAQSALFAEGLRDALRELEELRRSLPSHSPLEERIDFCLHSLGNNNYPVRFRVSTTLNGVTSVRYFNPGTQEVEIIFSERFYDAMTHALRGEDDDQAAGRWVLLERLYHELGHTNTSPADDDAYFHEEHDQIFSDLLLLKYALSDPYRSEAVDRYFATRKGFGSGDYFRFLISLLQIEPRARSRAINKYLVKHLPRRITRTSVWAMGHRNDEKAAAAPEHGRTDLPVHFGESGQFVLDRIDSALNPAPTRKEILRLPLPGDSEDVWRGFHETKEALGYIVRLAGTNQLVAYLGAHPEEGKTGSGRVVYCFARAVDPQYQRMGIATRLLDQLVADARKLGYMDITFSVFPGYGRKFGVDKALIKYGARLEKAERDVPDPKSLRSLAAQRRYEIENQPLQDEIAKINRLADTERVSQSLQFLNEHPEAAIHLRLPLTTPAAGPERSRGAAALTTPAENEVLPRVVEFSSQKAKIDVAILSDETSLYSGNQSIAEYYAMPKSNLGLQDIAGIEQIPEITLAIRESVNNTILAWKGTASNGEDRFSISIKILKDQQAGSASQRVLRLVIDQPRLEENDWQKLVLNQRKLQEKGLPYLENTEERLNDHALRRWGNGLDTFAKLARQVPALLRYTRSVGQPGMRTELYIQLPPAGRPSPTRSPALDLKETRTSAAAPQEPPKSVVDQEPSIDAALARIITVATRWEKSGVLLSAEKFTAPFLKAETLIKNALSSKIQGLDRVGWVRRFKALIAVSEILELLESRNLPPVTIRRDESGRTNYNAYFLSFPSFIGAAHAKLFIRTDESAPMLEITLWDRKKGNEWYARFRIGADWLDEEVTEIRLAELLHVDIAGKSAPWVHRAPLSAAFSDSQNRKDVRAAYLKFLNYLKTRLETPLTAPSIPDSAPKRLPKSVAEAA